jgi:hypothetical protein
MPRGGRPTIAEHRSAAVGDGLRGRSVAGPPNRSPELQDSGQKWVLVKISLYLNTTRARICLYAILIHFLILRLIGPLLRLWRNNTGDGLLARYALAALHRHESDP